jgi:hypothetical protein
MIPSLHRIHVFVRFRALHQAPNRTKVKINQTLVAGATYEFMLDFDVKTQLSFRQEILKL